MGRQKRTRPPSGPGAPANLESRRATERADTRAAAERTLMELRRRELPLDQENWEKVAKEVDPPGCSWRATYRPHCRDLFGEDRPAILPNKQIAAAQAALSKAKQVIAERDEEISRLKAEITDLRQENAKLSQGTKRRRRKKRPQARQSGGEEGESV